MRLLSQRKLFSPKAFAPRALFASCIGMDAGLTILRVGGIDCATVKDEYFNSIRRFCNVSDCFLAGNFDFENLSSGGGKGGDLLSRTLDGKYIVKQLNGCDSKSLLEKEFLKSYVDLVSSVSESFLQSNVVYSFRSFF